MSIYDVIKDKVARGMLFPLLPKKGMPVRRALFVSESLWQVLTSPIGDVEWEQRVANLRADLEVFVEGRMVHPKYLFLLYPASKGVWEIRSVKDQPSIRILGSFAAKDVFIATNHALREDLGAWESREWKRVKKTAQAQWRNLFHTYQPKRGTKIKTLVTGAIDGRYFRDPPYR